MKRFIRTLVVSCATILTLSAAPPKVDTSTPKGTAKGVYDLAGAGDIAGMKKLFATPANDKEKELFNNGFSDDNYAPALSIAILEKFPTAEVPRAEKMAAYAKGEIDKMTEKIEGDTATLTPPATENSNGPFKLPILLKKVGGAWKIAITESRFLNMPPPQFKELHKARCEAMEQFTKDVKAGKYATFEEFNKAMDKKMAEIQKKFMPAPAPPPAPTPAPQPR